MPVTFRSAQTAQAIGTTALPIHVPTDAQAGDVGILFVVSQNNTITTNTPPAWTSIGQARGGQNITVDAYAKTLTASDPGADPVVTTDDGQIRIAAHLLVYTGAAMPTLAQSWTGTGAPTTPTLTATGPGLLLEQVANRSMDAGTWTWTPPAGRTERTDSGAGNIGQVGVSCATGDMTVTAGTVGGGTWTPTATSSHTAAWSIFLPEAQTVTPRVWHIAGAAGWVPSSLHRLT